MAGDWIAMRVDLPQDPAVYWLARTLSISRREVVGALHMLWSWFDQQSRDGHAAGVTTTDLDGVTGVTGLAAALLDLPADPWLIKHEDGSLSIPRFESWNGETGKKRALARRRQARKRAKDKDGPVTPPSRSSRDIGVTTEEVEAEREIEHTQEDAAAGAAAALAPPGPEIFVREDAPATAPVGASGAYAQFVAWWEGEYRTVLGTPYRASWKKDGPALRDLLRDFSLEELKVRAVRWLTTDQKWIADTDRALYLFASKINMPALLRKKPGKGRDVTVGRVEPAPPAAFGNGRVEL